MPKRIVQLSLLAAAVGLFATGCSAPQDPAAENSGEKEPIVVVDQNGEEQQLPGSIDRFVTTALPLPSVYAVTGEPLDKLVGMHPGSASAIKDSVMAAMYPDLLNVPSSFVQGDEINVEELLALKPDAVMYWAEYGNQRDAMKAAGIPIVGVKTQGDGDALVTFDSWVEIMGRMFGSTGKTDAVVDYGKRVKEEVAQKTASIDEKDKPRTLFLFNHDDKKITTSAQGHYGQGWIDAAGGVNVASELSGTPAISMEQIYEWNPDVIIITTFSQTMPEDLYNNTVPGQDWSNVKAVREGRVCKEPIGVYRWFPPSGDAPLMLKWMSETLYPDLFDYDMEAEIKAYYNEFYSYDISDDQVKGVLSSNPEAARGADWQYKSSNTK